MKQFAKLIGVGAGIGGLAVGFLIGRILGRGKRPA